MTEAGASIGAPKLRTVLAVLLFGLARSCPSISWSARCGRTTLPPGPSNLISSYVHKLRRLIGDPEAGSWSTQRAGYRCWPGRRHRRLAVHTAGRGRPRGPVPRATPGCGGPAGRGPRPVAGQPGAAGRPASGLVSAEAGRLEEARVEAPGAAHRGRSRLRPPGAGRGGAAQAARGSSAARGPVGPAHARPVRLGPAGGGPGGLRPGP